MTHQQDPRDFGAETEDSAVGTLLRTQRERLGKDLRDVASILRIRHVYLEAIENGRFSELPGSTYAVGFVRSYADHLGLVGGDVVLQFKEEAAADLRKRNELVFPSPVSEGRIPGGAIIFVAIVMAAAAYGGWYWLSSQDKSLAEIVPGLPDRLTDMVNGESQPEVQHPEVQPPEVQPPEVQPNVAEPAAEEAAIEAEPAAEEPVASTGAGETTATLAAEGVMAEAPAEAEDQAADVAEPEAEAQAVTQSQAEPAIAEVVAASPAAEMPAPAPTVQAAPQQAAEEAAVPAVPVPQADAFGEGSGVTRVSLLAEGDAWVQVRDADGQLLLTKLMKAGESFDIPNRRGITMMTGNAGAVKILFDGEALPPIGPMGAVMRDISLDPDALAARR